MAFAISANSVNFMQTFRLMKDTIAWIIGKYGTDKLRYSVILFSDDASTELTFDEDVPTPNTLIQRVQRLSRKTGGPDLNKALEEAKKVFESAGARPEARKVNAKLQYYRTELFSPLLWGESLVYLGGIPDICFSVVTHVCTWLEREHGVKFQVHFFKQVFSSWNLLKRF